MSKKEVKYLFLCSGKDCTKRGSEKLKKSIKSLLKESGRNKEIQIIQTHCMDKCKKGPNMIFEGEMYTSKKVDKWMTKKAVEG